MKLTVDLSELPAGVRKSFEHLNQESVARRILAAREGQKQLAHHYHANRPRAIDGLGGQSMVLHPLVDDLLADEYGRETVQSPEFRRWIANKWDAVRVRHEGTRTQVGYGTGIIPVNRRMRTIARYG